MFMKLASVIERIPNFGGVSYEDRIPKSDVMNAKDSDVDIAVYKFIFDVICTSICLLHISFGKHYPLFMFVPNPRDPHVHNPKQYAALLT